MNQGDEMRAMSVVGLLPVAGVLLMLAGCAGRGDTEFVLQFPQVNDQGSRAGQRACIPDPGGPSSCNDRGFGSRRLF